ncbi:hypothetical protein DWF74_10445 [Pseudomonas protegens]|nr:hypothetical protein DWF74_10445 [Pseudomonas protegens]
MMSRSRQLSYFDRRRTTTADYCPSFVPKLAERRSGKAKTGEEAEFRGLNEHSEPVFNAA